MPTGGCLSEGFVDRCVACSSILKVLLWVKQKTKCVLIWTNQASNRMSIIDIFIVTCSLNLSLVYSLAPSLACSVSVLPHETNRGYNCWWASLYVILIIPSWEPLLCSALKVQKLQRPAQTENNKLNRAHNKREGCMHTLANSWSSPERGLMRACRLNPTTLSPFPDGHPPSVPPVAPSTANSILVSLNFFLCSGHSCYINLLGLFRQELAWKSGSGSGGFSRSWVFICDCVAWLFICVKVKYWYEGWLKVFMDRVNNLNVLLLFYWLLLGILKWLTVL